MYLFRGGLVKVLFCSKIVGLLLLQLKLKTKAKAKAKPELLRRPRQSTVSERILDRKKRAKNDAEDVPGHQNWSQKLILEGSGRPGSLRGRSGTRSGRSRDALGTARGRSGDAM